MTGGSSWYGVSSMLNMNFLFWNIRGLGKGEKVATIRNLVINNGISFMGLVETKHRRSIKGRIKRLWGCDDYDMCEVLASINYSGGIVVVWEASKFCVVNKYVNERWVIIEGKIINNNFDCCVGIIYSPNDRQGRYALYGE